MSDANAAVEQARQAAVRVDQAQRRAQPVLRRLERHLADDHIYEAVLDTIVGRQ